MLTIETLRNYGANVDEGLSRCLNMEDFYLSLVAKEAEDVNFARLEAAVETGDAKAAFEAAHALKGALGNLSLTPILNPVSEMTERFRGQTEMQDVSDLMPSYREALDGLRALAD